MHIARNGTVRNTVINAALAYEMSPTGDQWRRVFKRAINALQTKAGMEYRFYVAMEQQSKKSMDRVVGVLNNEN